MSLQRTITQDMCKEDLPWEKASREITKNCLDNAKTMGHINKDITVLLLGSGGRESAMAYAITRSPLCHRLFIAPGNGGTDCYGTNVDIDPNQFDDIASFVEDKNIDIIVVGPEEPLVGGIVDHFASHPSLCHIPVIGPSKAGAQLEGSKEFSKNFMTRHSIPTAAYRSFHKGQENEAVAFLGSLHPPYVLKADGLAAGKGVEILASIDEARTSLLEILGGKFGTAGDTVLVEQFLSGVECSVFVASDGSNYCILPVAKDYKRVGDGDTGSNTGGMGAISPVTFANNTFMDKVEQRIIQPTIQGLQKEGINYRGFIFFGIMSIDGEPYVIEYNCRLGDPESEVILPRIKSDFLALLLSIAAGSIDCYKLKTDPRPAATVMLVSRGYPESYDRGYEIDLPTPPDDVLLFHAGTKKTGSRKIVTNGGRVLAVTGYGATAQAATRRVYTIASQVLFEGKNYRHDIGADLA